MRRAADRRAAVDPFLFCAAHHSGQHLPAALQHCGRHRGGQVPRRSAACRHQRRRAHRGRGERLGYRRDHRHRRAVRADVRRGGLDAAALHERDCAARRRGADAGHCRGRHRLLGAAPARAGHGGGRLPRGGGLSAAGVRGIDLLLPLQLLRLHAALVRQLAHTVRHSARLVHAPRTARRAVRRRACLGHPRRGVLYGAVPGVFGGVVHSVRRAALPAADAQAQRAAL